MLLAAGVGFTACDDDDDDYSISSTPVVTEVKTGDAVVTAVSATISNGIVKDLSKVSSSSYEVGVIYGTSEDPTSGGSRTAGTLSNDTVSTTLTDLTTGTTYYYATYVCLQSTVYTYGEVKSFTATNATATTEEASGVSYTKATIAATFTGLDGLGDVESGIKVGRSSDASTLMEGLDREPGEVSGLFPGTTYYYLAYVKVGNGYVQSDVKSFTTEVQTMEYVDLGLSVMWAKCNIGAEEEEGIGSLIGYGDRTGELLSGDLIDYASTDISDTELDVTNAFDIDGDSPMLSAMPTLDQVKELISNTTQEKTTVNGVEGVLFTAANGNSIFLPYTGYRDEEEVIADGKGYYWTGTVSTVNSSYANTLAIEGDEATNGNSLRYYGLALRTVRPYAEITFEDSDQSLLAVGDIEGNGNIRIEIYNAYGPTASAGSIIDPTSVTFSNNMVVTFKISGLTDNYKESAAQSNIAGLTFTDSSWGAGHWNDLTGDKYTANVTGDGIYSVYTETGGASDAYVFCIDISGLANDLTDASLVTAEIVSIKFDADIEQVINQDIVEFNLKDGDEEAGNGRIEIYNEYGNSGAAANGYYNSSLNFVGNMSVTFTISGIDGNLVDGASANYTTELSYAAAVDWYPNYWGGSEYGRAYVTGDGTYTVYATFNDYCDGAVVWTIELYGLWADLVDTSKVSVTVDRVVTASKN